MGGGAGIACWCACRTTLHLLLAIPGRIFALIMCTRQRFRSLNSLPRQQQRLIKINLSTQYNTTQRKPKRNAKMITPTKQHYSPAHFSFPNRACTIPITTSIPISRPNPPHPKYTRRRKRRKKKPPFFLSVSCNARSTLDQHHTTFFTLAPRHIRRRFHSTNL